MKVSEGGLARMRAADAEAKDWYATCRVCGERIKGSLEELKEHVKCHEHDSPRHP